MQSFNFLFIELFYFVNSFNVEQLIFRLFLQLVCFELLSINKILVCFPEYTDVTPRLFLRY